MRVLLFAFQVLAGLTTLSLLGTIIVRAYHGRPSRRLPRWTLGFVAAFVVLTLLRQ